VELWLRAPGLPDWPTPDIPTWWSRHGNELDTQFPSAVVGVSGKLNYGSLFSIAKRHSITTGFRRKCKYRLSILGR
jgi:hypothetical protein